MSAVALRLVGGREPRRVPEATELCVIVACHDLVCALPARCIERLVLPDEVAVDARGAEAGRGRVWQIVRVGEGRYAGCNLGTQLGLAPVAAAWALLRVRHRGVELPLALQTGACLVVQHLGAGVPLPAGIFRARGGAVASVFATAALKSRGGTVETGVWLDPERLWVEAELDAAAVALDDSGGAR